MGKNSGKGACKDANKDTGRDGEKEVTDVKELRDLLKMFEDFKKDFRAEMRDLKDGISFCTDVCNDVKDTATDIKNLRLEMQELLRQNIELREENKRLSERCDELEQYQRLNNIEVKGAPAESDPVTVLQKIGEAVGESIDATDIDICHWVSTPKRGVKNIVVRFVRRSKRNDVLAKCRKKRVDCSILGCAQKTPLFVNEHLTQKNKALLSAAIQKKKEVGWKFAWTTNGRVLVRRDEDSPVIHIAHEGNLAQIRN
ncbi:hypothetical protein HPB48_011831 [Haemaphysalis longicornis]|uniref:FP protein C-terminal domain-containing protein n=1 Tax=Haemaphysalis longicornis TaxID=44386 RepID=A0A9J6FQ23_HAELO|nr:hypothetical protein HPB48_011831 [Haemaphysalis longicornis]